MQLKDKIRIIENHKRMNKDMLEGNYMDKLRTQEERLNYLLEEFKADSDNYKEIAIPDSVGEKQALLRSLMNIRMPKKMSDQVIRIQDDYLTGRAQEKGIVRLADIPVAKDNLSIWQGDITRLEVDAIVNAANSMMLGCFLPMHTCIDNQIHTFAGIQLRQECNEKMDQLRARYGPDYEQATAIPMLTDAYNLPARKVIHIVGPIVANKLTLESEKNLEDCYTNTLDMCLENGLKSVAFSCISTGVFHFPNKRAAEIAVNTVGKWSLKHPNSMDRIIFNVFKDEDKKYYEELLR
ncbi:macro domain protein [Peptostreptococcus stomatis DSM 17678]|uniref:Macro domain protein n=2 Tax=Peptostreptococcus TaxID=1257 RepID=E0E2B6_9FIRM|nr:protein-ADP-ribose hydrolase [Peptostreptococcus stomatis]EFM64955.1 macro domain protein [Peptostreptococcus stomatis DSM 17678]